MITLRWTTFAVFLLCMFAVGITGERHILVLIFAALLFVAHCWTYRDHKAAAVRRARRRART